MTKKLAIIHTLSNLDITKQKEKELYFTLVELFDVELFGNIKEQPRQSGQSTRQIDSYIQELFRNGIILVKDHFATSLNNDNSNNSHNNSKLFIRLTERLENEHPMVKLDIDNKKFIIKLVNE